MASWVSKTILATLTAALAACGQPYQSTTELNVLFVGNSYTFDHNVPGLVEKIRPVRDGVRYRFSTGMLADGGQNLIEYVNDPRLLRLLNDFDWDVIILQERSVAVAYADQQESFQRASDWFDRTAGREGAALVYFQTWPRRDGHEFYMASAAPGFTPPRSPQAMTDQVAQMYANVARRHEAAIAPVGQCWFRSENFAGLFSADGSHASASGARLTATVIANTLSGSDTPCEG